MDQRQVFNNNQELLSIIRSISDQGLKASLLVDKEGLTRVEGSITSINEQEATEHTSIVIDDSYNCVLKEIIGINGIFRSDYSEC